MGKKRSPGKSIKRTFQFSLDRIQMFFLICGSLLTCALCFTLGLMLGYQLSGLSIKKQLPSKEEIASLVEKSRDISFYETLVESPKKSATERPAAPLPKLKTKATTGYAVQVAAFKRRKSARKLRDELKEMEYPAYIAQNAKGEKEKWFRVRLGRYVTRQQAQAVVEQLKQETKLKPFIVR